MNVVVTGGRDFGCFAATLTADASTYVREAAALSDRRDRALLFSVLDEIHEDKPITLMRNGGMTGADALSSRWAYERRVDTECIGALWGQYGPKAGPLRNDWLLSRPTDLLVAFPGGRGTASTIGIARRRGFEVREVAL